MTSLVNYTTFSFSFLLTFVVGCLILPNLSISDNILYSTQSLTISDNRTINSPGDIFRLGFFAMDSNSRWYLGIWYANDPEHERNYVWVANRDSPLSNSTGILKIEGPDLVLRNQSNEVVWSTNRSGYTRSPLLVGELFDNGNFVLREADNNKKGEDGFLWQSFDFPTDTLLPQMKLGTSSNTILRNWKARNDPSSGIFTFELKCEGLPEFFKKNISNYQPSSIDYRSGPWDGTQFNGTIDEQNCIFTMINHSNSDRMSLTHDGFLQVHSKFKSSFKWGTILSVPGDYCDNYHSCGPYTYCEESKAPFFCHCIKGFYRNRNESRISLWNHECVRRTELNCHSDGFQRLKAIKLPYTEGVIVDRKISPKKCRQRCLQNCYCTAYVTTDIKKGGWGCAIWTGPLLDIVSNTVDGRHDLYIRLAASDLDPVEEEKNKIGKILGSIGGIIVLFLLCLTIFYFWKKKQKLARNISSPTGAENNNNNQDLPSIEATIFSRDNITLPMMEFGSIVVATDHFSEANKLGQGGFGAVYKGRLSGGQEIAVKRLSKMSAQGNREFNNEVQLIARVRHLNLVQLLAWCVEGGEKMLIYEYLENGSLDRYIFYKNQSSKLNWGLRFDIIKGIANGIRYLHQESCIKIIHRDLKPSNILLDKYMTPKISDFGLARIFGRDETNAETRHLVGTFGYMSPEYTEDGIYSIKSDVFSFGVLILEIITGKKNRGFETSEGKTSLLRYVWHKWAEGKWMDIVDDPILLDGGSTLEVKRCIEVALACVQDNAEDRPVMSSVISLVKGETQSHSQPTEQNLWVTKSGLVLVQLIPNLGL